MEAESVERSRLIAEHHPYPGNDFILENIEVEIHERGMLVRFLQTARIHRYGEACLGISQYGAED